MAELPRRWTGIVFIFVTGILKRLSWTSLLFLTGEEKDVHSYHVSARHGRVELAAVERLQLTIRFALDMKMGSRKSYFHHGLLFRAD